MKKQILPAFATLLLAGCDARVTPLPAEKTVEKNKPLVAQSAATQAQFTSMMTELDQLAKAGDKDADIIIKGYGIKVNEGAVAPAPAEPVKPN